MSLSNSLPSKYTIMDIYSSQENCYCLVYLPSHTYKVAGRYIHDITYSGAVHAKPVAMASSIRSLTLIAVGASYR